MHSLLLALYTLIQPLNVIVIYQMYNLALILTTGSLLRLFFDQVGYSSMNIDEGDPSRNKSLEKHHHNVCIAMRSSFAYTAVVQVA